MKLCPLPLSTIPHSADESIKPTDKEKQSAPFVAVVQVCRRPRVARRSEDHASSMGGGPPFLTPPSHRSDTKKHTRNKRPRLTDTPPPAFPGKPPIYRRRLAPKIPSIYSAQQLGLEDVVAFLVLLGVLVRLVVLPADRLLALGAADVAHDVAAGGHVALDGLGLGDVDDGVEEVGFAVLAAEILRSD